MSLPAFLADAALFLFCYGLYQYAPHFSGEKATNDVITGFTATVLIVYVVSLFMAASFPNSPYHTPLSAIPRFFVHFFKKPKEYLRPLREYLRKLGKYLGQLWKYLGQLWRYLGWLGRKYLRQLGGYLGRFWEWIKQLGKYLGQSWGWIKQALVRKKQHPGPNPGGPGVGGEGKKQRPGPNPGSPDVESRGDLSELPVTSNQPLPPSKQEPDWDGYALGSDSVILMLEESGDIGVLADFVTEIGWRPGTLATPLEAFYGAVIMCFDHLSEDPVLIPKHMDKAYRCAMALLYIAVQCKCIGDKSDLATLALVSTQHQLMGLTRYHTKDTDLESTLHMIGYIFGDPGPVDWEKSFTAQHHAKMARLLLYSAWDSVKRGGHLPDDIMCFVHHSLRPGFSPPPSVVADCTFIIGLDIGIRLCINDLLVVDKR